MKRLNNRGFAISGILYGILILFLMILVSILKLMVVKVGNLTDQQEVVRENVEKVSIVSSGPELEKTSNYYKTLYRGKYVIKLNNNKECSVYLPRNIVLIIHNNYLKYLEPKKIKDPNDSSKEIIGVSLRDAKNEDYKSLGKCVDDVTNVTDFKISRFDKFLDQ